MLIVFPLSNIFSSIRMSIGSLAIRFVVEPVSLVYVTIWVVQNTFAVCLVVFPLSHIFTAIRPDLRPLTLSHSILPVTLINDSVVQFNGWKFGDFWTVKSIFYLPIILFGLPSIQKICDSLLYLPVTISLRLNSLGLLAYSSSPTYIFSCLDRFLLLLGTLFGLFRSLLLLSRSLGSFGLIFRIKMVIFCSFKMAVISFESIRLQIILNLLFLDRIDLRRQLIQLWASAYTHTHYFYC